MSGIVVGRFDEANQIYSVYSEHASGFWRPLLDHLSKFAEQPVAGNDSFQDAELRWVDTDIDQGPAFYETHRDHADVHAVFKGGEQLQIVNNSEVLQPQEPYNAKEDATLFHLKHDKYRGNPLFLSPLLLSPGMYVIIPPGVGHRPMNPDGSNTHLTKYVAKVPGKYLH